MDWQEINVWDETRWCVEQSQLLEQARLCLAENPAADQVIVVKTMQGHMHTVINRSITRGDHTNEDNCIHLLEQQKDTAVFCVVAMWNGNLVDVPSWHFRKKLLSLNPNNEKTLSILWGADSFHMRPLNALMPPHNLNQKGT